MQQIYALFGAQPGLVYCNVREIREAIQANNNARKLGKQPDDCLAVNQNSTHRRNCNITVCFYT